MSVTFKDNSKQVLAQMDKLISEALERIGLEWIKQVTEIINSRYGKPIVDTGKFRQSMSYKVDIPNKKVIVGSTLRDPPYSIYIELGTAKMQARPWLKPSVMEFIPLYQEIVEDTLGKGWTVSAA